MRILARVLCALLPVIFIATPVIDAQSSPTFTVTSIVDDASGVAANCNQTQNGATPLPNCNLRDALAAVASLGSPSSVPTINFANTLNTGSGTITPTANNPATYTLTATQGMITYNSVNVVGPGAALLNISDATTHQIFVLAGGNISISGLTFSQGYGGNGGAIDSYVDFTVSNCVFSQNSSSDSGGAIESQGSLTVTNSVFSQNSSQKSGAIDGGSLTVIGSTFAGNTATDGGAIESSNNLTVINSTFFNNSASLDFGGAINNYYGKLTVVGSTFIGNSAGGGGAIFTGPFAEISNSIISGNTAPSGWGSGIAVSGGTSTLTVLTNDVIADIVETALPGYPLGTYTNTDSVIAGVNGVTSINVALAPLASYGGPTQTMIPLPGSQAICAGTTNPGNDALGNPIVLSSTDQRGQPRTNSSYPGYASLMPCVDAGAVQTAYSMSFTTEPPSSVTENAAFNAAVTLDESGNGFVPGVQIPLTLNQSSGGTAQLIGGAATTTIGAVAQFSLKVSNTGTGDSLAASLILNGSLNSPPGLALAAASNPFDVTSAAVAPAITWNQPAAITWPTPLGSMQLNATASVPGTFAYSPGAGTILAPGSQTLNTTFTPTDSTDYTTATASVVIAVDKATPTIALTATPNPADNLQTVTFTATVSSSVGSPTGSVTFWSGNTQLGTANLTNGSATFSLSTLTTGGYLISAQYSGDDDFTGVASTNLTLNINSFLLTTPSGGSTSSTVSPGGTATYTLNVTPPGNNPVTFSVTGLPAGATSSFSPSSVPAGAVATNVTLSVTVPSQSSAAIPASLGRASRLPIAFGTLLLPLLRLRRLRKSSRFLLILILTIAGAVGITTLSGCGGGGNSGGGGQRQPQSYTLTVSATAGAQTQSTTLTLTVQ